MPQDNSHLAAPGTKIAMGPTGQEMQAAIEIARNFLRTHSELSHEAILARQFLRTNGLSA